jgi:hypothetical protein
MHLNQLIDANIKAFFGLNTNQEHPANSKFEDKQSDTRSEQISAEFRQKFYHTFNQVMSNK